jgi:ABC-type branched-subunit amino acid transport system substrate-binding protein
METTMVRRFALTVLLLLFTACFGTARAEDIVLGNTLPLSGPLGPAGKAALAGMQAYLARVDREGGVAGRQVVLRSLDDAYQPERYAANVRRLLEQDHVDALLLSAGTSNIEQAYPAIRQAGRPLIGALTGAATLRDTDHALIYHLRASYGDEVRRLVGQAHAVTQTRAFAVWQDDGLGRDAFAALEPALKAQGLALVGQQGVAPAALDGAAIAKAIEASKADALFLLCVTPCAAKVLSALGSEQVHGLTAYALSIVNGENLAAKVGDAARGTVISQVLPNPHTATTALVRRYRQDLRAYSGGQADFSYFSLEGYLTAVAAVEAARIAYGGPVKHSMDEAMRLLTHRDIEGMPVSSGASPGVRPHPVELSMIGAGGRLIH